MSSFFNSLFGFAKKKVTRRKCPPNSAQSYRVGTKRKGKDGHVYIVKKDARGYKRWVKAPNYSKRQHLRDRTIRNKGRKSPRQSATLYRIGKKKRGLDGNMYIVRKSGSSRRWFRV